MSALSVVHFANTFVDRPGNIGVRTGQLIAAHSRVAINMACVCRGVESSVPAATYYSMGPLGHVPRILNGVRILFMPSFNHRIADIWLFEWFGARAIANMLPSIRPTVAHIWDTCPRLIERLNTLGIPTILEVPIAPMAYSQRLTRQGQAPFMRSDQRLIDIEREAYEAATTLLAPSQFVKDELLELGIANEKIEVVEFGLPKSRFFSKRRATVGSRNGLRYCFVGNVCYRKGIRELIEAWSDSLFIGHSLHLYGRVFEEVKHLVGSMKPANVAVHGFVPIQEHLHSCDVLVLPSWMEGSSKAVLEAMAAGLPCIVTRSSGSVVRDGVDGYIVEPGDVRGLRERMRTFAMNPELIDLMGQNARNRAEEFSAERYAARVWSLYEEVAT